ncbi:hypothetical protein [Nonomuraea endophytica]|uniref:hypothetical protein n=1 Tax=Nonomuraea endophytica TaxID=714136 RepID=UPI0037CA88A0
MTSTLLPGPVGQRDRQLAPDLARGAMLALIAVARGGRAGARAHGPRARPGRAQRTRAHRALPRRARPHEQGGRRDETTVKTHLAHIYAKLGVSDRAAAVAAGYDRGLLP